jgi:hypothetical protein
MSCTVHEKQQEAIERERREKSLELGLEDSMAASDPVAAVQPAPPVKEPDAAPLRLDRHDASDIVQLSDGSRWRVWPGDVPVTLQWLPTTEFLVSEVDDEHCSHVLINLADKSRIRVIDAERAWPIEHVRASFKAG